MRIFKIVCFTVFLLLLTAVPVLAETQTLFGNVRESTSVWGFNLKNSPVANQFGLWLGGYSGRILNDGELYIGSEGYVLLSPIGAPQVIVNDIGESNIGLFYCGLTLEYNLKPNNLIHFSGSIMGGLLYAKYVEVDYNVADGEAGLGFVVEPGVNAVVNMTNSLKVGVGVSYRLVSGLSIRGLTDADLTGLSINLTFKFIEF